jgi:hypothetical protein
MALRARNLALVVLTLGTLELSACSSADGPGDANGDANGEGSQTAAASAVSRQRYFTVTPDMRRCVSPLCGGYFVQAVNNAFTVCADGTRAERCYVASIDWTAMGGDPQIVATTVVVEGSVRPKVYPTFGNLGVLVAKGAWGSATAATPAGRYFRLTDNGIVCITAPCFSINAEVLNQGTIITLSGLDLSRVGATPGQLEAAQQALSAGALLATGKLTNPTFPAGTGRDLVASQFFLPPKLSSQCKSDADCTSGTWCRQTQDGGNECVPFVGEGKSCNGFTVPWLYERCEPHLTCDTPPFVADAPGVCRSSCKSNADCKAAQYCASDKLCHDDATCDFSVDCNLEGNAYPHILCVGYGVCSDSSCGWQCGEPRCLDLFGYDFGPCDAVLGWGVVQGACTTISGCSSNGFELFASEKECVSACSSR